MNSNLITQQFKYTIDQLANAHGNPFLVKEKDACGVGFIASINNLPSHRVVIRALEALNSMEHRGGCGADRDSGDGSGITTQIPWKLFCKQNSEIAKHNPEDGSVAVAMVFLPKKDTDRYIEIIKWILQEEKTDLISIRDVPTIDAVLGKQAYLNKPIIKQIFIKINNKANKQEIDNILFLLRKKIEKSISNTSLPSEKDFYICSLSNKIIIYKGMVRSAVLGQFYQDLYHPDYESSFAVYHRRFSTNTMPKWPLAQPMRLIAHNGEINTLLGNLNWMKTRENLVRELHNEDQDKVNHLFPIVNSENSDSANLDASVELLLNTGFSPEESLMSLIPEAYKNQPALKNYPEIVDFYNYYAPLQEAWDGPALVTFTDGYKIGATLDRNGLRPARYCITNDNLLIVSSEAGVVEVASNTILKKGRLGPGQMIILNLNEKQVYENWEIKNRVAHKRPYGEWLSKNKKTLDILDYKNNTLCEVTDLLKLQTLFGYSLEDVELVIEQMAHQAKEPTFCMGDDTPLAVLSGRPHLAYDYFKQRFAQVTNPAIDPIREKLVMSLAMYINISGNLLSQDGEGAQFIELPSPILNENELDQLTVLVKSKKISTLFSLDDGDQSLSLAIHKICQESKEAIENNSRVIILSDKDLVENTNLAFIPPLLAVGAVHHHLIRNNLRHKVSIIVETAQCWSTHHFACLIGYGATAICPYLAFETTRHWWNNPKTQSFMDRGKLAKCSLAQAQANYKNAIETGLLKILSKMGISLLTSYHGAQIFEILGLNSDVVNLCFVGTTSRIGGLTLEELCKEISNFYLLTAKENKTKLTNLGFVQYRPGGEYHINNPEMSKALHKAVRGYDKKEYKTYSNVLNQRPPTAIRDLLKIESDRPSIGLNEVEPSSEIVKRFCTGGMSLGALSRETHETLAIAMNRIGAKSNSGEGGEDPIRFLYINDIDAEGQSKHFKHLKGLREGDTANSFIKQIASGRFGVTPEYLVNALQLEIKIAQGAKPGEGGQLPGKKVSQYIATLRGCKPGVTLISPPPHHDIYSIEDLSQLIFDLHQINPKAAVSVKLVAEVGIGTIAAGVAKANADIIQVSGHDGGTGASPLSSIKHAGGPWELGLTEVQQVLLENQLRERVLLRVDGGLRTGRDIILAALMGAEEFGFGTVAMIATGCIMARICHTNSCPVGVATQRKELRARYPGVPEALVNFFLFIAEEIREILAEMGYKSLEEIIGRIDLLKQNSDVQITKTQNINLSSILNTPKEHDNRDWIKNPGIHSNGLVLDDDILSSKDIQVAINEHKKIEKHIRIVNTDRTVGARIAGHIALKYGNFGYNGNLTLNFYGSAGQSFAAFNIKGMNIRLIGEANDYVCKGINGGKVVILPPQDMSVEKSNQVIIGNTCLYGASGGTLFALGQAGERFAVRNSGALAVVEGVGDHACEYMTGGIVVILGQIGRNIAAGMTGGLAYIFDADNTVFDYLNKETVSIQRVITKAGAKQLRTIIEDYVNETSSQKAIEILDRWEINQQKFWQLVPAAESNIAETNLFVENEMSAIL
uniref:Ferredoxin-dependent glutamate synthase n=1 Tax=Porphyridium sordidum TaxID=28024 RepID=A0A1C9CE29_PORSO|nr:ferredoxin-dependent glutamate synthase [Porphyridium sordidum]AOM66612.1 ferredoxin-dependent glutamate synthase [Porphyridium sordidum]